MIFQKVCKVCNKFLKETKRSGALYCGKRCKNKAVTLRKNKSVLKTLEPANNYEPGHPLYGAPNIFDIYLKIGELDTQRALHERNIQHYKETQEIKDNIRLLQKKKENEAQEIKDKMSLFVFTNLIEPIIAKSKSDLIEKNIKSQSDFMHFTADDFADF